MFSVVFVCLRGVVGGLTVQGVNSLVGGGRAGAGQQSRGSTGPRWTDPSLNRCNRDGVKVGIPHNVNGMVSCFNNVLKLYPYQ